MHEKQEFFTLLGGAVKMRRSKYNPTSDAVWLAAFTPNDAKTILDVGIGTGGVALCVHAHNKNAKITGIDIDPEMLDICQQNAELNNTQIETFLQDIITWSTPRTFDLVITNPPYFRGTPTTKSPAAHHNINITQWIRRSIARVRPHGYFCTIIDAARLGECISAIGKNCGSITIIPLFGANQEIAERVLVRCRICDHGPTVLHRGLQMNNDAILRDGLTINKILSKIDA